AGLVDVTLVDQRPLGRSSRSNPVTYVKAYDEIRNLFAATPDARARKITTAHFSFNVERGRCPACQGTGVTEVDMQLMAPVTAPSTLSGGEAQRLRLASSLPRPPADGQPLSLFDEPTTGLHLADIDLLYHPLRRLVQRGDGVVLLEHSPDLIARCDWIVDLGPG